MKFIICVLIAIIALSTFSFDFGKCEHVFTKVEKDSISIPKPNFLGSGFYIQPRWPSGDQEGIDLICVKCFYVKRQILHYETQDNRNIMLKDKFYWHVDSINPIKQKGDSCGVWRASHKNTDNQKLLTGEALVVDTVYLKHLK